MKNEEFLHWSTKLIQLDSIFIGKFIQSKQWITFESILVDGTEWILFTTLHHSSCEVDDCMSKKSNPISIDSVSRNICWFLWHWPLINQGLINLRLILMIIFMINRENCGFNWNLCKFSLLIEVNFRWWETSL